MQHVDISAAEGQEVAALTVSTLQSIRSDEMFDLFWVKIQRLRVANGVDIDPPVCHEEEKLQRDLRLEVVKLLILSRLKIMYRRLYFEALVLAINVLFTWHIAAEIPWKHNNHCQFQLLFSCSAFLLHRYRGTCLRLLW